MLKLLGHDARLILHALGMRGLHRRLLQKQSLCHSVTVHQPSVAGCLSSCQTDICSCARALQFFNLSWLVFGAALISPCIPLSRYRPVPFLFAAFVIMSSRFVFDCVFIAQLVLWYFSFEGLHGLGLGGPNGGPGCRPPSRSKSRGHYCHCPLWCFRYLVCNRSPS